MRSHKVQPPLTMSLPQIWAQLCPLPPWRPGHFATPHVQISLRSTSGQQFALANLPRMATPRSLDLRCARQGPNGLLTPPSDPEGVTLLLWGDIAPPLTWRQTLQRGVHRNIPGFVSCPWKWLSFLPVLPKDTVVMVPTIRRWNNSLEPVLKTSEMKNPYVGSFKGKAARGTCNEVLLLCSGWKLRGKWSSRYQALWAMGKSSADPSRHLFKQACSWKVAWWFGGMFCILRMLNDPW